MREYSIGKRSYRRLSQSTLSKLNKTYIFRKKYSFTSQPRCKSTIFTMINLIAQTAVSLAIISLLIKVYNSSRLVLIFSYGLIFYLVKKFHVNLEMKI